MINKDYETNYEKKVNQMEQVTIQGTSKILEQMKNCICKIYKAKGTGFFCQIPYENQKLKVLITNYHVINENFIHDNDVIQISINDDIIFKSIYLNKARKIYLNKKYDIAMIEIIESDKINNYLELDEKLLTENSQLIYESNNSIYIIQYPNFEKASVSYGLLKNIYDNYKLNHICNTQPGSSGSPILNLKTNNVIGIHTSSKANNFNIGTFLKETIENLKDDLREINEIKKINKIQNCKNNNYFVNIFQNNNNFHLNLKKETEFKGIIKNINRKRPKSGKIIQSLMPKINQNIFNINKNKKSFNQMIFKLGKSQVIKKRPKSGINPNINLLLKQNIPNIQSFSRSSEMFYNPKKMFGITNKFIKFPNIYGNFEKNLKQKYPGKNKIKSFTICSKGLVKTGLNYMNPIIQCFSHIEKLTKYLLNSKDIKNDKNKLTYSYLEILRNIWINNNDTKPYCPSNFQNLIFIMNPFVKEISPKDFILFLIKNMHKELNIAIKINFLMNLRYLIGINNLIYF